MILPAFPRVIVLCCKPNVGEGVKELEFPNTTWADWKSKACSNSWQLCGPLLLPWMGCCWLSFSFPLFIFGLTNDGLSQCNSVGLSWQVCRPTFPLPSLPLPFSLSPLPPPPLSLFCWQGLSWRTGLDLEESLGRCNFQAANFLETDLSTGSVGGGGGGGG